MPKYAPVVAARRAALNLKTTQEIRDRLEISAQESGRSLIDEVEYRVQGSFENEEITKFFFGNEVSSDMFRNMSAAIKLVRGIAAVRKFSEEDLRIAVRSAMIAIVELYTWAPSAPLSDGPSGAYASGSFHGFPPAALGYEAAHQVMSSALDDRHRPHDDLGKTADELPQRWTSPNPSRGSRSTRTYSDADSA